MVSRLLTTLSALAALTICTFPAAAADQACQNYPRKQRIYRLGGNSISEAPITSRQNLIEEIEHHRDELNGLLRSRGLDDLVPQISHALETGEGLSERPLNPGDTFEWMAYRGPSGPTTAGPMCIATNDARDAYEIKVVETKGVEAGDSPSCDFTATGDMASGQLSVNASGISEGVTVTMTGPAGSRTVVESGGSKTWSGSWEDRYNQTYTFTARAPGRVAQRTRTTYTFVLPKICLNLAFTGARTEQFEERVDGCEKTVTVEAPVEPPSCEIQLDPNPAKKREPVNYSVTGHWADNGLKLQVTKDGQVIETLTSDAGTVTYRKKGDYVFRGTATNEAGDTATCEANLCVGRGCTPTDRDSQWTARFYGALVRPDDSRHDTAQTLPNGDARRSSFELRNGEGFGANIEYHFNERVGLEAGLLVANVGASFKLDINDEWEIDTDDVGLLAFTLGPNFHLTPNSRVDFYLGPFIGFASLDDATFSTLGETNSTSFDDEFIWGGQLGLDIPFGDSNWGFHAGLLYMDLSSDDIDFDPIIPTAGLAVKF